MYQYMALTVLLGIAIQLYAVKLHYFSNTPYFSEVQKIAFYLSVEQGVNNVKTLNWFSKQNVVLDVVGDINEKRVSELLLSHGYQASEDNSNKEMVWRKIDKKYYYIVVKKSILFISIGEKNDDEIYHFTTSYQ